MWGLLLVSVEIVGMYPGLVSSTFVTTSQLVPVASSFWVGHATVVFVYRTRFILFWLPAEAAETQTTWRNPPESIAIEGSAEAYEYRMGLSADRPEARMIWEPHEDPLVSRLRTRTMRSQVFVVVTFARSTHRSEAVPSPPPASRNRMEGAPALYSGVVMSYV